MGSLKVITLEHGGGGKESWELLDKLIFSKVPEKLKVALDGLGINVPDDGAAIKVGDKYIVLAIDSYTVKPIEFPGGNIGTLAASGSLNDVLMMGARPIAIMDSVVVEEGFNLELLEEIINSFLKVVVSEGVAVIGGDLKVMPKGSIDGIIITTLGVGITNNLITDNEISVGDKIIVSGPIAEHGATILALQLGYEEYIKDLMSDSKPLTNLMMPLVEKYASAVSGARDPTRGGLAQTLAEWSKLTNLTIIIDRANIPVRAPVKYFLDLLGIDPLNVASEGVAVLAVKPYVAEEVLSYIRKLGFKDAEIIGEVIKPPSPVTKGKVLVRTEIGGLTFIEPQAAPVPRIC